MIAIYKRELNSYFTSPIGYVFIAIFLAISGGVFAMSTLFAMSSDTTEYFTYMLFLYVVLVPLLTMKSFSEERTNIYNSLNEITYLTDLATNYDKLVQEYKDYELTLQEIEKSSEDLKVNCYKRDYAETDINNKVSAFT